MQGPQNIHEKLGHGLVEFVLLNLFPNRVLIFFRTSSNHHTLLIDSHCIDDSFLLRAADKAD